MSEKQEKRKRRFVKATLWLARAMRTDRPTLMQDALMASPGHGLRAALDREALGVGRDVQAVFRFKLGEASRG